MVKHIFKGLLFITAISCLESCDFFTTNPFPDFVDETDISINLSSQIDSIAGDESSIDFDLQIVSAELEDPRVLLLVEPPSSDDDAGFDYKGQLIFMDLDLNVIGEVGTESSLDYFSQPYAYAHDGNILAGYTILTPSAEHSSTTINAHGLEGFALTNGSETYIFALPSGEYADFELEYRGYNASNWGLFLTGTLDLIPEEARPSESVSNYENLGYQLVGLSYNSSTTEITFVLSEPSEQRILAARTTLAAATSGSGVLLSSVDQWPVSGSSWPVFVGEVDRPMVYTETEGLFLIRRDGWLDYHEWTSSGDLSFEGNDIQIVGDRSLTRCYSFYIPQSTGDDSYMFRFDPSSGMLTRYRRWW